MAKTWNKDTKRFNDLSNNTIKCSCGHSVLVIQPKVLCTWCGSYVYKDKRLEFEERLKDSLKRED